jgi:CheY-like chemotaxis protein
MVYGFVAQSGGYVDIASTPGEGTTIRLFLPRLLVPVEAGEERGSSEARPGSQNETILVVEDDEDVRNYAIEGLRELGYSVLEAHDAQAAADLLKYSGKSVDLLLTDVIMPGMTGRDLGELARIYQPGLRILYMSGYPRDVIMQDGRLETGIELLPKPFTYQALGARVRDMLDH